jgi:hypothetical protein
MRMRVSYPADLPAIERGQNCHALGSLARDSVCEPAKTQAASGSYAHRDNCVALTTADDTFVRFDP